MITRNYFIGLLIVASFSLRTLAVDKTFTSSGSIFEDETYYTVRAYNDGTVVNMYGGTIGGDFNIYDSSNAIIHGGTISMDLNAFDSSYIELSGGNIADDIYLYETSKIKLQSGVIQDNLQLYDSSEGWVYNGTILGNLGVHNSSILSLYGGNTDYVLWADGSSTVNIYGHDLALTSTGGTIGFGQISGWWENQMAFAISLDSATTYTHLVLHEIPEPSTLLLLGVGGMLIRKR